MNPWWSIAIIVAILVATFIVVRRVWKDAKRIQKIVPQEPHVIERAQSKPRPAQRVHWQSGNGKSLDTTKMKSLQPGNTRQVQEIQTKTPQDVGNFTYRFFGTQLELEGRAVIDGLIKTLHTLESLDGQTYVDGHPVRLHPDDLVKIARLAE